MKLQWSPEAIDDLISIRTYIAYDNSRAAVGVVTAITTLIERQLLQFPHSGRKGRVDQTLELIVPGLPFIVPYRVTKDAVEILRIFHSSRRWPDSL